MVKGFCKDVSFRIPDRFINDVRLMVHDQENVLITGIPLSRATKTKKVNPQCPSRNTNRLRFLKKLVLVLLLLSGFPAPTVLCPAQAGEAGNPFNAEVIEVRPRVFLRDDANFEGLTVQKLQKMVDHPEWSDFSGKLGRTPHGRAIRWMIRGNPKDLDAAIRGLMDMNARKGSWSGRGQKLFWLATLFDWLYEELDETERERVIHRIENNADDAIRHLKNGNAPFFYSRSPGAVVGLAISGIALKGVSPRAENYLDAFRKWGANELFRAYEWTDGMATGATYTLYYTYVDLPAACAAWWSATGQNPTDWIEKNQGDWLRGIVRSYLWYMRPGFAFTDINDQYRGIWGSHDQFCKGLDIATYVTRDGRGRSWSRRWYGKHGRRLLHGAYIRSLIFRDVKVNPGPLTDLPRAELFGRDSCGYVFFRSHWPAPGEPDNATHVFFAAGDPMNVHGNVHAGHFQMFRYAPLADRSGSYGNYGSARDLYHRNCISTNVVLFTDPDNPEDRGDQHTRLGLKTNHTTWEGWMNIRERYKHNVARITEWETGTEIARCRADLSETNPEKCETWIRELAWLGNRHLVVLDIVETTRKEINRTWQLHAPTRPNIGDHLITVENRAPDRKWKNPELRPERESATLFCRTLAPEHYSVLLHDRSEDRKKATVFSAGGRKKGNADGNPYHLKYGKEVIQLDPGRESTRTVFVNVLTALDTEETLTPPDAKLESVEPGTVRVMVEEQSVEMSVPEWFIP